MLYFGLELRVTDEGVTEEVQDSSREMPPFVYPKCDKLHVPFPKSVLLRQAVLKWCLHPPR